MSCIHVLDRLLNCVQLAALLFAPLLLDTKNVCLGTSPVCVSVCVCVRVCVPGGMLVYVWMHVRAHVRVTLCVYVWVYV